MFHNLNDNNFDGHFGGWSSKTLESNSFGIGFPCQNHFSNIVDDQQVFIRVILFNYTLGCQSSNSQL